MADAKVERGAASARPLSPHLQIYRMPVSMVMSIVHRITGAALYFGTLIVAAVLLAAASGPEPFDTVMGWLAWWPGQIVLIGYTWALLHHLAGGLRHFVWDTGHGFDLKTVDLLAWATLAFSAVGTLAIWGIAYVCTGGAGA